MQTQSLCCVNFSGKQLCKYSMQPTLLDLIGKSDFIRIFGPQIQCADKDFFHKLSVPTSVIKCIGAHIGTNVFVGALIGDLLVSRVACVGVSAPPWSISRYLLSLERVISLCIHAVCICVYCSPTQDPCVSYMHVRTQIQGQTASIRAVLPASLIAAMSAPSLSSFWHVAVWPSIAA